MQFSPHSDVTFSKKSHHHGKQKKNAHIAAALGHGFDSHWGCISFPCSPMQSHDHEHLHEPYGTVRFSKAAFCKITFGN